MARKISERLTTDEVAHYEATRYAGNQKLVDRIEQRIVRELLAMAAGSRKDFVSLDVPCGYGRFSAALLEVSSRLIDADRSTSMATRALSAAQAMGAKDPGSAVVDIRALPFASATFDVVLSMRLLHHLHDRPDRDAMFRELARVTREHVVISYYDTTVAHRLQRKIAGLTSAKRRRTKIFFFGTDRFTEEATTAGFEVRAVKAPLALVHAQRVALLRKKR